MNGAALDEAFSVRPRRSGDLWFRPFRRRHAVQGCSIFVVQPWSLLPDRYML
jgi:hypothetical protein